MNSSSRPLVTVVIPVFNREEMAITAVNSVFAQDYPEIELIVVDDGSANIPKRLQAVVQSGGGRFIRTEHRGVSHARNVGIAEAKGEWFALLDSDDCWLSNKLSTQIDFLNENREFQICQVSEVWYRGGVFVNPKDRHQMPHGEAFFRSLELCCISASSIIMNRELVSKEGFFREELPICEDYDYFLRLTANNQLASLDLGLVKKFGGRDDQLSRAQKALDRFRVYALLQLLKDKQLPMDKFIGVVDMLVAKARVLEHGVLKRDDQSRADIYRQVISNAQSWRSDMNLDRAICEKLAFAMKSEIELVIE